MKAGWRAISPISTISSPALSLRRIDRPRSGEHRIYNLGNHRPEQLLDFIGVLERLLGRTAIKRLLPMQLGDVPASYADIETARRDLGFEPRVTIETGLAAFVEWYRQYHGVT